MPIGSILRKIPGLLGINENPYAIQTPPFIGDSYSPDDTDQYAQPPAPPSAPQQVPPPLSTPQQAPPPMPALDPDTQKYLEMARQGSPIHPKHGTLRNVGEALAGAFIGDDLSGKIFDPTYSRQKTEYEHNLQNAQLPSQIYQKGTAGAAGTANTYGEARLKNKQAENYDANQTLAAIEHGGELEPDQPQGAPPPLSTPAQPGVAPTQPAAPGREGSTVKVAGRPIFFPSKKTVAEEAATARRKAEQDTYRPLPQEVTQALNLPADIKVPPNEVDSYLRIFEKKTADPSLKFESHVDENTGDVTTVGRDARTGELKFKDTVPGIAKKRPQVTSFVNSDAGQAAIDDVARGLANGDLTRLKDIASMRGDQRLQIYAKAKQYNPAFSTGELDRKIKMEDYYANGKGANNLQSFGTFLEHGGAAVDAAQAINQGNPRLLNKPLNWWKANMSGDPTYQAFVTALEPVRKEFEGFLLGGRALYGDDRKQAEIILNDSSSLGQVQAALKAMGHTAQARFNEENYRYKKVTGRDLEDPLSPEALAGAKRIGVNMGGSAPASPGNAAPASAAATKPLVQHSPSTGQYRYSTDGGKTWLPGQPPNR